MELLEYSVHPLELYCFFLFPLVCNCNPPLLSASIYVCQEHETESPTTSSEHISSPDIFDINGLIYVRTQDGQTAWSYASTSDHQEILNLLKCQSAGSMEYPGPGGDPPTDDDLNWPQLLVQGITHSIDQVIRIDRSG